MSGTAAKWCTCGACPAARCDQGSTSSTHSWITLSYLMTENRRTCRARRERRAVPGRAAEAAALWAGAMCHLGAVLPLAITTTCGVEFKPVQGPRATRRRGGASDHVGTQSCSISFHRPTQGTIAILITHAACQSAYSQQRNPHEDIANGSPLGGVQSHPAVLLRLCNAPMANWGGAGEGATLRSGAECHRRAVQETKCEGRQSAPKI